MCLTLAALPGVSETQALENVTLRLRRDPKAGHSAAGVLLEVDEVAPCLEKDDEKRVKSERKAVKQATHTYQDFADAWIRKRIQVRGRGGSGPAVKKRTLPGSMDRMSQKEAKAWMPVGRGICLWKSRSDQS